MRTNKAEPKIHGKSKGRISKPSLNKMKDLESPLKLGHYNVRKKTKNSSHFDVFFLRLPISKCKTYIASLLPVTVLITAVLTIYRARQISIEHEVSKMLYKFVKNMFTSYFH